ncbi:hypothetical protein GH714_032819 [Hevea brasiliensis]|uniref:Enoyl reductase (ER) domain-containing protein n=1 Tax=Hevea brasiliensis TaxID=3981 RepID=A0A6A6K9X7_HEVBR|nr:hypothetical protein GH714_032819 [Hevea brasiliensis]
MGRETSTVESKEWFMAAYAPQGVPTSDHLKLRTLTLSLGDDHIPDGHLAVEILWISVDPYLRVKMTGRKDGLDMPPFQLDQESQKAGSNVFISAAAGGVGMVAGQLAKLKGCRVIGSAGSDDKIKLLKEEFGYDDAFNYNKETDFDAALSKYFPEGIDLYLDNVGGSMLEAVLNHVNNHARIPLCGMISQYNKDCTKRDGIRNLFNMIGKEVRMEGFMIGSHLMNHFPDFVNEMEGYLSQDKMHFKHKIFNGIDRFLEGFASMFSSSNIGKVIIQLK